MGKPMGDLKPIENLVFIGFMTSGKSTQARLFAKAWGWTLVDTDDLIAEKTGRTPGEIIAADGEESFRRIETETLRALVSTSPKHHVVSTGGGMAAREENWPLLKALGPIVALWVSPETAVYRHNNASRKVKRPLLETEDPVNRAKELLEKRMPFYERAEIQLKTDGKVKDAVQNELTEKLARLYELPPPKRN